MRESTFEAAAEPVSTPGAGARDSTGPLARLADRVLLQRFQQSRDERAFAAIVERHGPLVLAACRRGATPACDPDDAFQATFLVLAQAAHKIRRRDALAPWLYGVATRISRRMRGQATKHHASRFSEEELMATAAARHDPLEELLARHDEAVADEELQGLPEPLRQPLVLRYLAGMSNAEVARELRLSLSAVEGRLKRGKEKLRRRLLYRGVSIASFVALLRESNASAWALPPGLVASTLNLCLNPPATPPTGDVGPADQSTTTPSSPPTPSSTSPLIEVARIELNAMPTPFASKPLAALLIAGVVVAGTAPLALSQAANEDSRVARMSRPLATGRVTLEAAPSSDAGKQTLDPLPLGTPPVRFVDGDATESPRQADRKQRGDDIEEFSDVGATGFRRAPGVIRSPSGPSSIPSTGSINAPSLPPLFPTADRATSTPAVWTAAQLSPIEQEIENALGQPLTQMGFKFIETPLIEVVDSLEEEYGIEVEIDQQALEQIGVAEDLPISIELKGVRLESALNRMLSQHELTFVLRDEVLLITSAEDALERLQTRVYRVDKFGVPAEKLAKIIEQTVQPNRWSTTGDFGDIVAGSNVLIVLQSNPVHREIAALLRQLRQMELSRVTPPTGAGLPVTVRPANGFDDELGVREAPSRGPHPRGRRGSFGSDKMGDADPLGG